MGFSRDIALIARHFRRQRNQYMEALQLKGCHARYLIEICQAPGITQDGLTRLLGVDKSNVARQVAFLEEAGYLERRSSEADKRVLRLHPTEKTMELLPGIQAAAAQWETDALQQLSADEQAQLTALLSKLWQQLQQRVKL